MCARLAARWLSCFPRPSPKNFAEGDEQFMGASKDGFAATPYAPSFDEALEAAGQFMHEYRDAFKALAS